MPRTRWPLAVVIALGGALVVTLVVLAFVWPTLTASAKNLPLVITGPSAEVTQVTANLKKESDDVFSITTVSDRAAAVRKVERRDAYGAIVLGQTPEVIVATAANTSIASELRAAATRLQEGLAAQVAAHGGDASTVTVAVSDVAPLASTDKNGTGLTVSAFPLVLGGVLGGVLLTMLVVGPIRRLLALVVYSIAVGAAIAFVLQTWFGILQRNWLDNAGALALAVGATAAIVSGCAALLGRPGIGVGAVLTMLVGNPLSGASLPWQFYPEPWGAIGQGFVPGASSSLLKDLSYFPHADVAGYWWTLAIWAAAGVLLTIVGHFRSQEPVRLPDAELEHEGTHVAAATP